MFRTTEKILQLLRKHNYESYMDFLAREQGLFCEFLNAEDVDDIHPVLLLKHLQNYFAARKQEILPTAILIDQISTSHRR